MATTLWRYIGVCALAALLVSCTEVLIESEGLRTPTEFSAITVEGNTLSLSDDGTRAVVWVNESLPKDPQWFGEEVVVVDATSLGMVQTYRLPYQLATGVSAACLNRSGDSVWYSSGGRLFQASLNTSEGSLIDVVDGDLLSLCYDPLRTVLYLYAGTSDATTIYAYNRYAFPSRQTLTTYAESVWFRYGSQRMKLSGDVLLFTPNGYAVDVASRQQLWSIEGDVTLLSPTTLVYLSRGTPVLLDVNKEDPQGVLHPQDEIYYSAGISSSKDGERFAVIYNTSSSMITDSNYVAVFNARNGEELYRIAPSQKGYGDEKTPITDVEFSPVDRTLLYVIDKEGNLCRWRLP